MNISNPAEGRIGREPELAGLGGGQAGVLSSVFPSFSLPPLLTCSSSSPLHQHHHLSHEDGQEEGVPGCALLQG